VCRQLKALEAFKDTPVIIISAKGSPDEIQAGLDAGAAEYIRKPFPIDNLTSRVRALLGAD
jgi:DNA-binding response OmpR family regulator